MRGFVATARQSSDPPWRDKRALGIVSTPPGEHSPDTKDKEPPVAVLEITDVQDRVLDAVRTGQDAVVDAVKTVADKLPSWSELPYADQLPSPGEVVDR